MPDEPYVASQRQSGRNVLPPGGVSPKLPAMRRSLSLTRGLALAVFAALTGCGGGEAPVAPLPATVAPAQDHTRSAADDDEKDCVAVARDAGAAAKAAPTLPAAADASAAAVAATTVPISDADRVVASLRAKFRHCYQSGLNGDPTMAGRVVIAARVDASGDVLSSEVAADCGLSAEVTTCIASVVKVAHFSPPGGGGSTLQIPVTFKQNRRRGTPAPRAN